MTSAPPTADAAADLPDPAGGSGRIEETATTAESNGQSSDTAVAEADVQPAEPVADEPRVRRLPPPPSWLPDVVICLGILLTACWLGRGLWPHPSTRVLSLNPTDQALNEWFLANGTRFYAGDLHLVSHLLNAPDGVNLLSNASLILLGILLAPITLAFGAPVSFAVAIVGNLAGTGIAWYLLLRHTLRLHRAGAAIGAGFAAFAPGMMSQSNGHLHITAQWLVPPIVWCVHRLATAADLNGRARWRRVGVAGVALAALVSAQLFLGEEVLFLAAFALALFCLVYALAAPVRAWRLLPTVGGGVALAAVLSGLLLAHPLWLQFAGPQHVPNGPFSASFFSTDLASFGSISPLSFAGSQATERLVSGPAEYTTFFGIPLLLVVGGATLWLWRRPAAVAATAAAVVMAVLSLGPHYVVNGTRTERRTPYGWIEGLPVVDGALPTRFALAMIPLIGLLLAYAVDHAVRESERLRLLVPLAVIVALVPIAPRPLATTDRPPVPRFFTDGYWRSCVPPGGVLVPVPLPEALNPDSMRWPAAADNQFAIPQGFFIGPYADNGQASVGIYPRATSQLLDKVDKTGQVPEITDDDRANAASDVAYWHASCVVLADRPNRAQLRTALDALFGTGQDVADVQVWHVG
jgi:hypothetical protein